MNQIIKVNDHDVSVIEWNNERVITTAQLADVYETDVNNVQNNFNRNQDRFDERKHYFILKGEELRAFKREVTDSDLVAPNVNQLYLWTRRGASRHCKLVGTDKAWDQFDNMEEAYFNPKASEHKCIEDVLIESLQEMKSMRERLNTQDTKIDTVESKLEGIKEVVAMNSIDWRKETSLLINKMALKMGGYEHIKAIREESYKFLEQRLAANLNTRVTNIKKNLALNGVGKAKIDKINQLDAIATDKRLIEGYVAIVKEMAIKYGVV